MFEFLLKKFLDINEKYEIRIENMINKYVTISEFCSNNVRYYIFRRTTNDLNLRTNVKPPRSLYMLGTSSCWDHLLQLRRYLTNLIYRFTESKVKLF